MHKEVRGGMDDCTTVERNAAWVKRTRKDEAEDDEDEAGDEDEIDSSDEANTDSDDEDEIDSDEEAHDDDIHPHKQHIKHNPRTSPFYSIIRC
jgi:hypothetical protein